MKWFCKHDWSIWSEPRIMDLEKYKGLRFMNRMVQTRNCIKCGTFRWKRI